MQNKKLIVLIILGIAAFLSLIYGIITPAKKGAISPENTAQQEAKPVLEKRDAKRTNFTSWGRSPFVLSAVKGSITLKLDGILWDKKSPKAIIDDNIVGIGDKVGNNTVVNITQDSVILNDGTKNFELRLGQ